jgi:hypothetical protein
MTVLGELFPDARGGVVSAGARMMMLQRAAGSGQPGAPPRGHPIVRYSLAPQGGQRLLMRAWQPEREEQPPVAIGGAGGGRVSVRGPGEVAFEPGLHSGVLPDGSLAYSDSTAYAIKIMGPDGALRRVLRRPLEPRATTRAIEDAERERRLAELEAGGGPQMRIVIGGPGGGAPQPVSQEQIREMRRGQIEQLRFYPEIPVVMDLATGWTGKIWVQRRGRGVAEPGPIDILTGAGEYLGSVAPEALALPRAFGPDGRVAFVERDELDVPRVVVRRLPPELR